MRGGGEEVEEKRKKDLRKVRQFITYFTER